MSRVYVVKILTIMILGCFFLTSCKKDPIEVNGLVPIYFDALDFSEIRTDSSRAVSQQGKILKVGDFLFINERKKGIHVVDNSVPGNPHYILFWNIPGNLNFTINENYLYADNGPHMLVIDISDFYNIQFDSYVEDAFFENLLEQFPEEANSGVFFECAVPEKGLVKEWIDHILINPNCRKI